MTVEELLQLPTIKGLKLISGNLGVHREISTVPSLILRMASSGKKEMKL